MCLFAKTLGGEKMQFKRQGFLIALVVLMIASMGFATAWNASWNSGTGQPNAVTSDGVNIYSANADSLKQITPAGQAGWSVSKVVANNGSCMKIGKYAYIGVGENIEALNKADGSNKWTATAPLGAGQAPKYILVKGAYVIVANDAKVVILDRETGAVSTPVQDAATTCEPMLFGGKMIGGTAAGVQAYNAVMLPDVRVKSVTKTTSAVTATIENIGLTDSTSTLVKFVVRKTDGTYRTIHLNGGTVNPDGTKDVTITGSFSKGYVIVDPYYKTPELNEGNNQRYFS